MMSQFENIGIIRLGSMGDILLTFPVISILRERFPGARLQYITKKRFGKLVALHPDVDEILTLDTGGEHATLRGVLKWCRERPGAIDLLVDLHANPRSILLGFLLPVERLVRYRKHHRSRRLLTTRLRRFSTFRYHTVELYTDALNGIGSSGTGSSRRRMAVDLADIRDRFLADHSLSEGDPIVGVSPGSTWRTKRWPYEKFAAVIDALLHNVSCKIVVLLPPGDADAAAVFRRKRNLIPFSSDSHATLGAAISAMNVLLTNDSGPMHMAETLDVPVLALFGPTHPSLGFSPRHPDSIALYGRAPCSPCSLHGRKTCGKPEQICFTRIGVMEVAERITGMLKRGERR